MLEIQQWTKQTKCCLLYNLHSILVSEQNQSQKKLATVVIPKEQRSWETSRGQIPPLWPFALTPQFTKPKWMLTRLHVCQRVSSELNDLKQKQTKTLKIKTIPHGLLLFLKTKEHLIPLLETGQSIKLLRNHTYYWNGFKLTFILFVRDKTECVNLISQINKERKFKLQLIMQPNETFFTFKDKQENCYRITLKIN